MSVSLKKSILRKKTLAKLRRMSSASRAHASELAASYFEMTEDYEKSKKIVVYLALPEEVGTRKLIRRALKAGKEIYAPKVDAKTKKINLYQIKDLKKDLRKGAYGILEPRALKARKALARSMDIVVVPGVAFDENGGRLGRGVGYYDRFLVKAKKASKIALAYRMQLVNKVPMEKHDIRMDWVITA